MCHHDFNEDSVKVKREEKNLYVLEIVCPECGKMVRPDVTLYGEFLPEEAYQNAISMIREADVGCAVANAIPAVREAADLVVAANPDCSIRDIVDRVIPMLRR